MSRRAVYSTLAAAVLVTAMVVLGRSPSREPAPVEDSATASPVTDQAPVRTPTPASPTSTTADRVALPADPEVGVLVGRVIDPLGNVLQRCEVTAQVAPTAITVQRQARGEPSRVLTDELGRFHLEHRAGEPLIVTLSHKDFPPTVVRTDAVLVVGRPTDLGDLTLRSLPGLVVTVTAAAGGQPIEQARIEMRPQLEDPTLPGTALELARRWAVTDRQGRGILFGVEPGAYTLRVEATGFATVERSYLRAGDVAPQQESFALAPGQVLRGRVLTPDGIADPGARVAVCPLPGGPSFAANTAADGGFRLEGLTAGAYRLEVDSPSFGTLTASRIEVGPDTPPLEVRLAAGAELTGTVSEQDTGRAVADAVVSVTLADGRPLLRAGRIVRPATRSDGHGRFRLGGLPEAPLRVTVEAPRRAPATVGPVLPGTPCNVRLAAESGIEGRVVNAAGAPVPDATVRVVPAEHDGSAFADLLIEVIPTTTNVAHTNDNGSFRIGGLPAGSVKLLVRHHDYAPRLLPVPSLPPGAPVSIEVQLHPRRSVVGTVRDAEGQPVAGATVYLDPVPGSDGLAARATADAAGEFQLTPVAVGLYSLYSSKPGQPAARGPEIQLMVPRDKDPERQTVYAERR